MKAKILILAAILAAAPASAQEPMHYQVQVWKALLIQKSGTTDYWGGMAFGRLGLVGKLSAIARVEATASGASFSLDQPGTWKNVQTLGGLTYDLTSRFALAGIGGTAYSLEGEKVVNRPLIAAGGIRVATLGDGWTYILVGEDQTAGRGVRVLIGSWTPLKGAFGVKVDAVSGNGGYVILGATASWGG